jgi:hypothetical protein
MAEVEQVVQPPVKKEHAPGERPYWIHVAHDMPSMRGRAVKVKFKTGKVIKLYPATYIHGSGINEHWLTAAEAAELEKVKGITYCVPKVEGVTAPAPPPPPRIEPQLGTVPGGGISLETDDDDKD